jgi:MtrB/PioB family decaheme-associated outer membrane protein
MKLNKITQLLLMSLYAGMMAPLAAVANEVEDDADDFDDLDPPWVIQQQDYFTNRVEVGAFYVTDESLRAGQFDGAVDDGLYSIFNIDLSNLQTKSEVADFWNLKVSDAGLDSRFLSANFGIQGTYKVAFDYKEVISRELFMNDAMSEYAPGFGTDFLGDPGELGAVDAKLKRSIMNLDADWQFAEQWKISAKLHQEYKEGARTRSALGGGVNFFAEPVDTELTEFGLTLAYNTMNYQASIGFERSLWRNDYNAIEYMAGGAPQRLGVDPDNNFDQLKLELAWLVTPKTRLFLYGSLGEATQDDAYLPVSTQQNAPALPQANLNGEVDYSDLKLAVNHRFTNKLVMNMSYRYTDRDNKTAQNIYQYQSYDNAICWDLFRLGNCLEQNRPLSWSSDEYTLDLTYRLGRQWTFVAGALYEEKERTSHVADAQDEEKYWVKAKYRPNKLVTAEFKYTYADREPDEYEVHEHHRDWDLDENGEPKEDHRVNDEALRQMHKAARELNRSQASVRYTPSVNWSMGLSADLKEEDYGENYNLGLRTFDTTMYSADISYHPSEFINITLYASQSDFDGETLGGLSGAEDTQWQAVFEDDALLSGLTLNWELVEDILDFSAQVTYLDVEQTIEAIESTGEYTPYNPIQTDETTIELELIYRLEATSELKLGYQYSDYSNDDWQYFDLSEEHGLGFTNSVFDDESSHRIGLSYTTYY